MPEEKKLTKLQQQKAEKPMIEDLIPNFLNGNMKKIALDFVVYLRANKMNPVWTLIDTWKIDYKGKPLCRIRLLHPGWEKVLGKRKWGVHFYRNHINEYEKTVMSEGLQNIIWDNVSACSGCKSCAPGMNITLLGKEFKNVCNCNWTTWVFDPNEETIDGIKRLLKLEKKAREKIRHLSKL